MVFVLASILLAIGVMAWAIRHNARADRKTDEERMRELVIKARTMFPRAKNDIEALDLLYQPYVREMIERTSKKDPTYLDFKRDSILIFNAKNRAIKDALEFEDTVIKRIQSRSGNGKETSTADHDDTRVG